ncbi:MAG: hypothetical protein WCD00_05745, partial [Desulfuromonadaceae bacterium]
ANQAVTITGANLANTTEGLYYRLFLQGDLSMGTQPQSNFKGGNFFYLLDNHMSPSIINFK